MKRLILLLLSAIVLFGALNAFAGRDYIRDINACIKKNPLREDLEFWKEQVNLVRRENRKELSDLDKDMRYGATQGIPYDRAMLETLQTVHKDVERQMLAEIRRNRDVLQIYGIAAYCIYKEYIASSLYQEKGVFSVFRGSTREDTSKKIKARFSIKDFDLARRLFDKRSKRE